MIAWLAERRRFQRQPVLGDASQGLSLGLGELTFTWTFSSAFKVEFFSSY